MILTKEQVLEQCKQAVAASNANGLQVLALIAGVIRQVAPLPETVAEPAVASVALPEAAPVAPSSPVAEPLPEASPVEPQAQEPAYRFILNVPEIKNYEDTE